MIKSKVKYILGYLSVVLLTVYIAGCSDLETNIPPPPTVSVHQEGIIDPTSPEFHGNLVKKNYWDMTLCQDCHGKFYDGGLVNVSCLTCHNQLAGPENCATCHGSETSPAPPRDLDGNTAVTNIGVGAHQTHLTKNFKGKVLSCTECHIAPSSIYVSGHVDSESPAEVLMSNYFANLNTNEPSTFYYEQTLPLFVPDPVYNYSNQTCSNVYCHGYFKNGNLNNAPIWTSPASAVCGTCHGDLTAPTLSGQALPKTNSEGGSHIDNLNCYVCHAGVVDEDLKFINPSKHIDGLLNLFGSDIRY